MFLKSTIGLPALRLVDHEDLCFDVLLGDVNYSHFSSDVFLLPH